MQRAVAGEGTALSEKSPMRCSSAICLNIPSWRRPARTSPKRAEPSPSTQHRESTVHDAAQDRRIQSQPSQVQSSGLQVPDPRFSRTAARQPEGPAPIPAAPLGRPGVEQLRWARCPDHGQLHLVQPAAVGLAATQGYAEAFCGYQIAAEGLTISSAASGALCMACITAATSGHPCFS